MVFVMKLRRVAVLSAIVLLGGALGSTVAEARGGNRGHSHHGGGGGRAFFYAAPIFAGAYIASRYYYPPVYYPAPAYYPSTPPVYIEQGPAVAPLPPQAQPQSQAYWYYCASSHAYYPHVQTCATGWQRVAPQPPPN
jgi:hypothetical protein